MSVGTQVINDQVLIDVGQYNADPLNIRHGSADNTTAIVIHGKRVGGRSDLVFRDDQGRDIAKVSSHNGDDPTSDQNHGFQVYVRNANGSAWYSPFVIYTFRDTGSVDIVGQLVVDGVTRTDRLRLESPSVPVLASANGNAGDIAWDSNYVYICVATNTWKRTALSSW